MEDIDPMDFGGSATARPYLWSSAGYCYARWKDVARLRELLWLATTLIFLALILVSNVLNSGEASPIGVLLGAQMLTLAIANALLIGRQDAWEERYHAAQQGQVQITA